MKYRIILPLSLPIVQVIILITQYFVIYLVSSRIKAQLGMLLKILLKSFTSLSKSVSLLQSKKQPSYIKNFLTQAKFSKTDD